MAVRRHSYKPRTRSPSKKLQSNCEWTSSETNLHPFRDLLTIAAMASAMLKRNLASASMDLTRLRELKGYPCGRFS
jgi:hypothetical protein